jgi:hypothetical protein
MAGSNDATLLARWSRVSPRGDPAGADKAGEGPHDPGRHRGGHARGDPGSQPARLFDRAVVKTLSQWKFSNGGDGRTVEIDLDFRR